MHVPQLLDCDVACDAAVVGGVWPPFSERNAVLARPAQ